MSDRLVSSTTDHGACDDRGCGLQRHTTAESSAASATKEGRERAGHRNQAERLQRPPLRALASGEVRALGALAQMRA
jgi:hypothetical protein